MTSDYLIFYSQNRLVVGWSDRTVFLQLCSGNSISVFREQYFSSCGPWDGAGWSWSLVTIISFTVSLKRSGSQTFPPGSHVVVALNQLTLFTWPGVPLLRHPPMVACHGRLCNRHQIARDRLLVQQQNQTHVQLWCKTDSWLRFDKYIGTMSTSLKLVQLVNFNHTSIDMK